MRASVRSRAPGVIGATYHEAAVRQDDLDEHWMSAPPGDAMALQRPLPDGALIVVARGEKQDPLAGRSFEKLLL